MHDLIDGEARKSAKVEIIHNPVSELASGFGPGYVQALTQNHVLRGLFGFPTQKHEQRPRHVIDRTQRLILKNDDKSALVSCAEAFDLHAFPRRRVDIVDVFLIEKAMPSYAWYHSAELCGELHFNCTSIALQLHVGIPRARFSSTNSHGIEVGAHVKFRLPEGDALEAELELVDLDFRDCPFIGRVACMMEVRKESPVS